MTAPETAGDRRTLIHSGQATAPRPPTRWTVLVIQAVVLLAGFTALAARWYWSFRSEPFAMDDPWLITLFSNDSLGIGDRTLYNVMAARWRPVTNTAYFLATAAFGENYFRWWLLNMALLGALATACTMLFFWLSKRFWIGVALGLLVVTSRFSGYQALQATGLVESLGNLLFVALLATLLVYMKSGRRIVLGTGVVAYTLLVLTHERYQGLIVAILVILLLYGTTIRSRLLWALAFVAPIVLTTLVKLFIFHIPLAVGPGSAQDLGFTWQVALDNVVLAIAGVFGVNLGSPNLSGLTFPALSIALQGVSLVVLALTALLVLAPIVNELGVRWREQPSSAALARRTIAAAVLVPSLLLPVVVVSRLEPRFIVTSSLLLLAAVAYFARPMPVVLVRRGLTNAMVVLFVALSLVMNSTYRGGIDLVYYRTQQIAVAQELSILVPSFQQNAKEGTSIYLVYPDVDFGLSSVFNQIVAANTEGVAPADITVVMAAEDVPADDTSAIVITFGGIGLERLR